MLNKDKDLTIKEGLQFYDRSIEETFKLYLLNLYTLIQTAKFAQKDLEQRKKKHIQSEQDLSFSAKLYDNKLLQSLVTNQGLQKMFEKEDFESKVDKDLLKRVYRLFQSEESYRKYIDSESTDEDHVFILHDLYRFCRKDDVFDELIEDIYASWMDDKSLVVGAIKKTIKGLPVEEDFYKAYKPDHETVDEFGRELLKKVYEDDNYLKSLIDPVLENWDSDRVALVDMIFLKMAVCEFLNFVTIPTKVTLNEFVELSKQYSTERSKDFINGILDKLMRLMKEEGMIKKEGRGLLA